MEAARSAGMEQSRLQALLEAAPVGITFADTSGKIVLGNLAGVTIDFVRRFCSAEWTDEHLLRRIPLGLGAARGTRVLLKR